VNSDYEYIVTSAVFARLQSGRGGRRKALAVFAEIAASPHHPGDRTIITPKSRTIIERKLHGLRVRYWVDHAVSEVRIVDLGTY